MNELILVSPSKKYIKELFDFRKEIIFNDALNEDKFAGCMSLESYDDVEEWIKLCKLRENEETCLSAGVEVPSHTFFAIRICDHRLVGIIDLRHHIMHPILGSWGGHSGYTVRPSERGRGYAKEMLKLNLMEAKKLGIHKFLITCSETNIASKKTILSNGGVYEKSIPVDGKMIQRYWIDIK